MNPRTLLFPLALVLSACPSKEPPADTDDTGDTGPEDTDDTGDTGPEDTGDTDDTGPEDTGDIPEFCPDYAADTLGACLAWDGDAPAGFDTDAFTVRVAGQVTATGVGAPPVDCTWADTLVGHAPLGPADNIAGDDAAWVQLADDAGATWTLAWHLPGFAAPALGTAVVVDVDWRRGFAETRGEARLSDASGGLLGWIGSESAIAAFDLPAGLSVSLGDPLCLEEFDCYSWGMSFVDVWEGDSEARLGLGSSAELESLRVTMAEATSYSHTGECSDGPVDVHRLAVTPL